jgi:hypothetical protein
MRPCFSVGLELNFIQAANSQMTNCHHCCAISGLAEVLWLAGVERESAVFVW